MEGLSGNCASMIVRPATNQRIEHSYQCRLRQILLFLHQRSDSPHEGLYAILRRLYQHAVVVPTYIPSEEVEALLDMRDAGLLGREFQPPSLEKARDHRGLTSCSNSSRELPQMMKSSA